MQLLEQQLSIGYGLNACIHPYTFDRRTDTSKFTYPLIEGISFFEIVKTLALRKGININVRNSDGVSAVEMGIRRLSTALRSTAASSTWKTDGEKRDLPVILHALLAMGAKRPTGQLANEACYKKIVKKLVRERWEVGREGVPPPFRLGGPENVPVECRDAQRRPVRQEQPRHVQPVLQGGGRDTALLVKQASAFSACPPGADCVYYELSCPSVPPERSERRRRPSATSLYRTLLCLPFCFL